MNRRIVPVLVAVSALVAASCGGSDGSESSPGTSAAGVSTTVPAEDTAVASTDPPPPTTEPAPAPAPTSAPAPGTGMLPDDTGPELQWVEVATDVRVPPGQLMWTGSSFIIGSHDATGLTFLRSEDGIDWQSLSGLPDGVDWYGLHAAEESIVVWGTDLGESESSDSPNARIIVSTDGGTSWDELDAGDSLGESSTSNHLLTGSNVYGAATSGNVVIVAVRSFAELDFEGIVVDRGVDPARVWGVDRTADGVSICLAPVGSEPGGDAEADEPDEEGFESCAETVLVTYEELGLSDADVAAVEASSESIAIHRSIAGGPFEAAEIDDPEEMDWQPGWLHVVDGEFVASIMIVSDVDPEEFDETTGLIADTRTIIYRSADGLEWEHGEPMAIIEDPSTDGSVMYARQYSGERPVFVRSDDRGRTWTEFVVPGVPVEQVFHLSAGAAGLAVVGALFEEPGGEESTGFLIEKDGYRLSMTDDNETIVVDLETGETVLFLGPEDEGMSELVIEDDEGVTLLDEDTLEPLVSITWSEFEEAFERAFETNRSEPAFFIGWSGDGEHWGWQTVSEAFGANGAGQLAVGDGTVVAMYQAFEESGASTVRVFAARTD